MESIDLNKIPVLETEGHTSKGNQIHFHFGAKEVQEELGRLNEAYSGEVIVRVERLLREQMRRYAYLMG